jgi:membrane protein
VIVVSGMIHFIKSGIWEVRLKNLSPVKSFLIRDLRVLILALGGFLRDKCLLRASALTYYSLLSIVPLFALVFGIAKGFGLETFIRNQIIQLAERANWPSEVVEQVVLFSSKLLEATKGGLVAGIGVALLLWTAISILGNIEEAFNDIWRVRRSRSLIRKFTDYISIMVFGPILIVISSSLNVVVASEIQAIVQRIELLGAVSPFIFFLLKFLPYLSIWALLLMSYIVLPNTKVSLKSAVLAGVATGTVFQVIQWIYITFQIGASKYGAIYGSFAALPLFLAWLQLSWMIVLFGAEIAVADENYETYGFHPDYARLSVASRKVLALKVLHLLVKRFVQGERPLTAVEISATLEIPVRLNRRLLDELIGARLVTETCRQGHREDTYQPGLATERLTIEFALEAYEQQGSNPAFLTSGENETIASYVRAISEEMINSPKNVLLKEI